MLKNLYFNFPLRGTYAIPNWVRFNVLLCLITTFIGLDPATLRGQTGSESGQSGSDIPVDSSLGRFVGKLYDAKTGETISGVALTLEEIGRSTLTNDEGWFIIDEVPPGNYTVTINQIGYQPLSIPNFEVASGRVTSLSSQRGALEPSPIEEGEEVYQLDTLEVVAELVEEGEASQLFDRRELEQLISSLGKDDFSKIGAGDVASAIGRMAGANVLDGKYAVIRGLADRYSNTTLNGALIPSADPSKRAVQLDLIATHLLERLETSKTYLPHMTAEFAGGLVDIQTLKFPEELMIDFSSGIEYNTEATKERFLINPDRRMDLLGRVGDELPSVSGVLDFPSGVATDRDPPSANQVRAREEWRRIHNKGGFLPDRTSAPLNTSFSFSVGNSLETEQGTLGFVLAFDQSHKFSTRLDREINRGSFTTGSFSTRQSQFQNVYEESIDWGGLANLAFRSKDENHIIGLTLMSSNSAADTVIQGRRVQDQEDGQFIGSDGQEIPRIRRYLGKDARVFRAYDEIGYTNRSLDVGQFSGNHKFTRFNDLEMDYMISSANAEEDRPDHRHLKSFQLDYNDPFLIGRNPDHVDPTLGTVFTQSNVLGGNSKNSYRTYSNITESALFGQLGFTLPVWERGDGTSLSLKFGASLFDRDREVRGRLFGYDYASDLRNRINNDNVFGVDFHNSIRKDDYINGTGLNRRGDGMFITDFTASGGEVRNVDAFSETNAAYLSGVFRRKGWLLTAGARVEDEVRGFEILSGLNDPLVVKSFPNQENQHILPAISLQYAFGSDEQFKLRTSYGRTVARPTFYEFAPVKTIDQTTGLQIQGNPGLEDTIIDNYDMGFEWYLSDTEMVALNFFYKEMKNPIVTTMGLENGTTFFRSWQNSETGTIRGVELEFRKLFWEYWTFGANFAYIDSEIGPLAGAGGNTGSAGVYEGQPKYIINLNLGFDYPEWGLSTNLVYNYTDDMLTDVTSSTSVPNVFQEGTHSLDLFVSKSFNNGFKMKFGAENLLGSDFRKYYEDQDLTYDAYRRPTYYSFGLEWSY